MHIAKPGPQGEKQISAPDCKSTSIRYLSFAQRFKDLVRSCRRFGPLADRVVDGHYDRMRVCQGMADTVGAAACIALARFQKLQIHSGHVQPYLHLSIETLPEQVKSPPDQ